ncbi:Zinc finger HIT domain-containing protein 2 [Stylophora pistillata]|uniref:Zinc finger HIT domain-containing protein 2 n=2 Tax=Stylophora pistillata TaxID=50429 RepID=A0A2B4S4K7_STYPI|nr:Zinc finger HIT domain-containing protein 2 [Stylophora pistillata]
MEAMCDQQSSREDKRKMLELLQKLKKQDEEEGVQDTVDLEERLQNIDINNDTDAVWSALTNRERKEFESAVKSGEISGAIDVWIPWWTKVNDGNYRKKIEVISEGSSILEKKGEQSDQIQTEEKERIQNMPAVKKNISSLQSLMKNLNVNPNVQFSCIDVLYSYAYIMRLYNGCPEDSLEQAAENLLQLSPVLSKNAVFGSVESVAHSSLSAVQDCKDLSCSEEFSLQVLLDVISLIKGYVVIERKKITFVDSALSHLCQLLSGGRERLKANSKMNQQEADLCKSLWLAKKKVEFLLAWAHTNPNILQSLLLNMEVVHTDLSMSNRQHREQREKLEQAWGGSKPPMKASLITEI